jgi:hypothetical protein
MRKIPAIESAHTLENFKGNDKFKLKNNVDRSRPRLR